MLISAQEQQQINELARQFEATTGAQAVAAVVGRADDYPDIPWKAFALGVGLASLVVVADEFIRPDWASIHSPLRDAAAILATGVLCALLVRYVPALARLLLDRERAAAEVQQYAEGIFLKRGLFGTRERVGILLLVCRFERKVYVLPDSGIARYLPRAALDRAIATMTPQLAHWQPAAAFGAGFDSLAASLAQANFRPQTHGNELQDGTVIEGGPV